jgi:L-lactate dehydrogenase complex protein LldG
MSARAHILDAVRTALKDSPAVPDIPRGYRSAVELGADELTHILVDRLEDYKAGVTVVAEADVPATIQGLLADAATYVVPAGLEPDWLAWETNLPALSTTAARTAFCQWSNSTRLTPS